MTLKVRRNSLGAQSLSSFTTPNSSPGSSHCNSKDIAEDSASSSSSSSPTMFRKLRQRRNKKGKTVDIVLYKGVIFNFVLSPQLFFKKGVTLFSNIRQLSFVQSYLPVVIIFRV